MIVPKNATCVKAMNDLLSGNDNVNVLMHKQTLLSNDNARQWLIADILYQARG